VWTPGDSVAVDGGTQELTILDDQGAVVQSVSLDASTSSFQSDPLVPGATYTLVVATVDANGTAQATSAPVTTTTTAPLPPTLTNLSADAGDGVVTVSWDALDPLVAAGLTAIVVTDDAGDSCTAAPTDTSCALSVQNGVPLTIAATVTGDGGSTTTNLSGTVLAVATPDPGAVDPSTVQVNLVGGVWIAQWTQPDALDGVDSYLVTDDQGDSCQSATSSPGAIATCALSADPTTEPTGVLVTTVSSVPEPPQVDPSTIQLEDTGGYWVASWTEPSDITTAWSYVVTDDAGDTCTAPSTAAGAVASCLLAPDSAAAPTGVSVAVSAVNALDGCGASVPGEVLCADGSTTSGGDPRVDAYSSIPTLTFNAVVPSPERMERVAHGVVVTDRRAAGAAPTTGAVGTSPLHRSDSTLWLVLGGLSILGLGLGLARWRLQR